VTSQEKRKFLSEEEVKKLLSYINSQADSARKKGSSRAVIDEIIVLLLIYAGLKPDELCKLRIEDLPLIHGENSILIYNAGEVVRKILIPSELSDLLKRFVILYRKQAKPKDPLLQSERGNPFSYMSLYNKVRRIGKEAGISKLSPSMLRHTYILQLYESEQDLRYVQEQTGYGSLRTVAKYVMKEGNQRKSHVGKSSVGLTEQTAIKRRCKNLEQTLACEACGRNIIKGGGKRIDSGQLICNCRSSAKMIQRGL